MKVPRLSEKERLILELLAADECYGLELVAASRRRLSRGTVYVTLGRMEEKGYITSRIETPGAGNGPYRRVYKTTTYGARLLKAWALLLARLAPEHA